MKALATVIALVACDAGSAPPRTAPLRYVTLIAGHGAHPAPTDWIAVYGGRPGDPRETYYFARPVLASTIDPAFDVTSMEVGGKRRLLADHTDLELAAILGPHAPATVAQFPPPSDAMVAGDSRYVVIAAPPTTTRAAPADRVMFSTTATDHDGKPIELGGDRGTQVLGDITLEPLADQLSEMGANETRRVWTMIAGAPVWISIIVYSIEHRPQVAPPPDLAHPPGYLVVTPGTGEPPAAEDELVFDQTVWTTGGRTIVTAHGETALANSFVQALTDQWTTMRTGEHRKVWLARPAAGELSEGGLGVMADLQLIAIHRNIDLLPGGIRIVHDGETNAVRGPARAVLPVAFHQLTSARLANGVVTFTGDNACEVETTAVLPLTQIEALLAAAPDDVSALRRAIAIAPEMLVLYARLAMRELRAGHPHDAARVLAPFVRANPVWLDQQLHDQLALLATDPLLVPLHIAPTKKLLLSTTVANGRFIAVPVSESDGDEVRQRIEILDRATGAQILSLANVDWLSELGFAKPRDLELGVTEGEGFSTKSFAFPATGIVIREDGTVVRNGKILARDLDTGAIQQATWSAGLLILQEGRSGSEGCETSNPRWLHVLRLRAS